MKDTTVGAGYPLSQLARALVTAAEHEDPRVREQAGERARRWAHVVEGLASGRVKIGSRAPLTGLPAWVTPEVLRGGFATGHPAASGPLRPHEHALAGQAGVPMTRAALFAYHLTEAGLAGLDAMLDNGGYRVRVPEEAVLLIVAWLLRSGRRLEALSLLDEVAPYADRLRFMPEPAGLPDPDPTIVWRETVGEVRDRLARCRANPRIEAMNEALTVWNPFADDLLRLWLSTVAEGRVAVVYPATWPRQAAELLDRYRDLAARHPHCTKHRRPKENIAILRSALEEVVAGRTLTPRARGLLQHAIDSMQRRRGDLGGERHAALRDHQREQAGRPTHAALASVVVARLASRRADVGDESVLDATLPIEADELSEFGVPVGTEIPEPLRAIAARARAGSIEQLIREGLVPSAEVLAHLVPRLAAAVVSGAYPHPALRPLMAAHYRAFRNRRSLLLLHLEHQVRADELPWVKAVANGRRATRRDPSAALRHVGMLALTTFPGTVLPNPLVRELATLAAEAGLDVPWVEELAADIFMGRFSPKFTAAAKLAAHLLRGTIYERYYGIDYDALTTIDDVRRRHGLIIRTSRTFDELCRERAGRPSRSVPGNGTIIEQAQILTTHNLATLAGPVGIEPRDGWASLARSGLGVITTLVTRLHRNPRPLSTIKDAAYTWRQMVFYLALAPGRERAEFGGWARTWVEAQPEHVGRRLEPALSGLEHVVAGGNFDADGGSAGGRRFLGWSVGRHWMSTIAD